MICWFSERATLTPGAKYAIKHTSNWARALVKDLQYRLDVNTLHRDETRDLAVAQRDRAGHAAHDAAAALRRVPPQPRDRLVHPRRRGQQRHRRRGHDRLAPRPAIASLAESVTRRRLGHGHEVAAAGFSRPGRLRSGPALVSARSGRVARRATCASSPGGASSTSRPGPASSRVCSHRPAPT